MSLLRNTMVAVLLGGLAACSTPPQNPNMSGNENTGDLATTDTAPGLEGYDENGAKVQIGGVNQDGIASVEIGGGQMIAEDIPADQMPPEVAVDFEPVIYFAYDQFGLSDEALAKIQYYSQILINNPSRKVVLEGHTDYRGTPEYNLALGEKRAKSVMDAMVSLGVDSTRIEANSYGEEYPVAFEKTEAAWQLNSRVEINIR